MMEVDKHTPLTDSPFHKVVSRLQGFNNGMAHCPAHDDKNKSLSVTKGDDERVLVHCHAGCTVNNIVEAMGLTLADLFPPSKSRDRHEIGRRTHNYPGYRKTIITFSDGSKTAFFERQENGLWAKGLNGLKQTLYNLDALNNPGTKFLSESEKDADHLTALGVLALSFGGAENWKAEYADLLEGQEVVILPHNDEPGRKAADRVTRDLVDKGCQVKVIPSETWGPHKGADVADWIQAGHTAKDLLELAVGALQHEQPKIKTIKDAILPAGSFINIPVQPRRCFLYPWLKEKSLVEIVAPRGIGKTWDALSIAIAACSGNGFGPWGGCDPVRGLYLDAEMATQDVIDRLKMLQFSMDTPLFILSNDFSHTLGIPPAHLGDAEWRKKFKEVLIEEKIELVILDNIASLTPGFDENSKQEWDPVNQYLLDLRRSGITVIFIHHAGKSGTARGTSGREDNLDIVIELRFPQGYAPEDGCRFIKHFTKHRLPQNELTLIQDTEFKLITEGDHYTWAWNDVKKEIKRECLRLLAEGIDQKSICAILGVTKGYVSKIKAGFIKKGFLSAKGEILPPGELYLGPKQETFEETFG